MQRRLPAASAGFKRFDASIAPPDVAPAPITVWISSMNMMAFGVRLELLDDLLQALFEIAAVARAGEKRAHVEREDGGAFEHLRHVALDDLLGEPFGDRRLADAGIAHIERIVLVAAAKHLDGALQLKLAPDQRIDLPGARLGVQIDAPGFERALLAARRLLGVVGFAARLLARAAHRADLLRARTLGDAVRDVVDRVVARHVLLLQEIGGVALALGEDRDEHVRAGHLLAPRRLHVDHRALDDALEAGGGLRLLAVDIDEVGELGVDIFVQVGAQLVEVDIAGPHDGGGVLIVGEREQQMLERSEFLVALVGQAQRLVESHFERAGK